MSQTSSSPNPPAPAAASSAPATAPSLAPKVIPAGMLTAFILVTGLFSLWGFANDITNPMVAVFKNVLQISNFESSLVQAAFYGGYCIMAIPAALFLNRFNYKTSILVGLGLYVAGCALFIPAGASMQFGIFLFAYFVMTCGLSFLETTANPYILSLGPPETATRRLNFAQAFNPCGSITGMFIAKYLILAQITLKDEAASSALSKLDAAKFAATQKADLDIVVVPYVVLGLVVAAVFLVFLFAKLPGSGRAEGTSLHVGDTLKRLFKNGAYLQGVLAQAFYVGVQIMCWTFIIQYAETELGMSKSAAQGWNIAAMATFVSSRFICTYLLKFVSPGGLLAALATGGGALILAVMFLPATAGFTTTLFNTGTAVAATPGAFFVPLGLLSLVGVSACMSLMFPTIYGIALRGLGNDAKIGSAGLILAIGGGAIFAPLQGWIIDQKTFFANLGLIDSTRASFVVALVCFIVIAAYGLRTKLVHHAKD